MAEARAPQLYTIPAHRAFADALAAGLLRRHSTGLELARGVVLLPNDRARRAVNDAFVRASGGGLLLPRLVILGDPALDEAAGATIEPADAEPVPPAIDPLQRRLALARMVEQARAEQANPIHAAEAVRLAGELARTLHQLQVEEVDPRALKAIDVEGLTEHWERSLALFNILIERWPRELAALGRIDPADRRNRLLEALGERWRETAPPGFVCAAGVTDTAPAVARLLRVASELDQGSVVFAGLNLEMAEGVWQSLGPHDSDPVSGRRMRAIETDPQFHLKLLMDRMGVARGEVEVWRDGGGPSATVARGRAIANALAPAAVTGEWSTLPGDQRRLSGVVAAELANPAEEATAIALAMREVLETEGKTAALVTPDRALARRVAAQCARWGIEVDDTAGRPLSLTPPGTLVSALAEAAASDFAPLPLMTLLKHPLVRSGELRGGWLEGVRAFDRALRGPRPAPGLDGIDRYLAEPPDRERAIRGAAAAWWTEARALLKPVAEAFAHGLQPLAALIGCLREAIGALAGDAAWAGPAGRGLADLFDRLEEHQAHGPGAVDPASLAPLLRNLTDEIAVRPPQGGYPRLAIYGQIEARLQTADLMIVGGLNENVWPGQPAPDPWLAPRIRAELGLPGLDRRVGMAAHDLAQALGAPEVLLTRARRDARAPAIASRFWLRLQALAGRQFARATDLESWSRKLDRPDEYAPARRPAPSPAAEHRPKRIAVTDVDRLKADPYAFYAKKILSLLPLDAIDADLSAAWRGTAVHDVLRAWAEDDGCAPERLADRARKLLEDERTHPMLRALWQPRLLEAIDWIAREMGEMQAKGRTVIAVEKKGEIEFAGVCLQGVFDRIDRTGEGGLAIVDYKTGKAPSAKAVRAGFSLQLGLLGLIAERGGFEGIEGKATEFEYWSLAKGRDGFGQITSPVDPAGKRDLIPTDEFVATAADNFTTAAGKWLTGDEPFTAKLQPEYATYADYDQLMRRDEWYGRERR